jgi:hypothetical protein
MNLGIKLEVECQLVGNECVVAEISGEKVIIN